MTFFAVFDSAGHLVRGGVCSPDQLPHQAAEGETALALDRDPKWYYVNTALKLTEYTDAQLALKEARPFGRGLRWSDQSMSWEDVRSLDDLQSTKRAEITAARNTEITTGFTYLGKPIDSDRDSVMAITGAAVAALAAKAAGLPYAVTWTCADDSTLDLDADGVLGMSVTLAQYADAQHTKGRPLKAAIAVATTAAEVAAIAW